MASTIKWFSKMTLGLVNSNVKRQIALNGCRNLYTESALGMTVYRQTRETCQERYKMALEGFKTKMKNELDDPKSMVFTEDLKAIVHLVENNPEDVALFKGMVQKFNSQSSELRFGSFVFGPVVMRAFYYLNDPHGALESFKNPEFQSFYDQHTTFTILLDLLYENGMYKEVVDTYSYIRENFSKGSAHPKMPVSIVAMACYNENTPESLDYGLKICKDLTARGSVPLRRVVVTLTALALKQNSPHIALELISLCKTQDYISIRTVRNMAFCDLDRLDNVTLSFQNSLKRGLPEKNQYYSDIVPKVEDAIKRLNIEPNAEVCELLEILKARNYISPTTLEKHLVTPMEVQKELPAPNMKYRSQGWADTRRKPSRWDTADRERTAPGYQ